MIEKILTDSIETKQRLLSEQSLLNDIDNVGLEMATALDEGNKIVLFGNGGSAADAQHIAAELSGKFERERMPLPAMALSTNTSAVTAIGNDFGYETVFSRQVGAFVTADDVVIGISTSGTSANVVEGIEQANSLDAMTAGLTGKGGGKLADIADVCLTVPSENTARIQEVHITIGHALCSLVEERLFA